MTYLQRVDARPAPWVTGETFWEPPILVDSAWQRHAPFAFWLVGALRPRTFVELGTHNGFSFFAVCEALKRFEVEAAATAVDTWVGDDHAGFYGNEVYESVRRIAAERYARVAKLRRATFDEAVAEIPHGSVDLLHIDGRHGYDDVTNDFETWIPTLSERAVVILHDTAERAPGFGVWQFWRDVEGRYPSFEFEHGHGLGVLAIGEDVPERVLEFLHSARDAPEAAEAWFAARGEAVARAHADLRAREAEARNAAAELAALRSEIDRLGQVIDGQNRERELILDSTSWRVTAPLRAVGALLHRSQ